jgi:PhzF family phenazine biosynthesis protein
MAEYAFHQVDVCTRTPLKGNPLAVVIGPQTAGETQFEVRGFAPGAGIPEDPVTGSLNAGLARWLIGAGLAPPRYVAAQGTALGRAGRVHISQDHETIWIGGDVVTCIEGTLTL